MIVNIHSKEIESKNTLEIINNLVAEKGLTPEDVVHISDKTPDEWKEIIKSNTPITFVGPVYWWGLGYEFDKWAQNVLSYGFAFEYRDGSPTGLLNERQFEMHLVHGTPVAFADVMKNNISERVTRGIFGYCNAKCEVKFYEMKH